MSKQEITPSNTRIALAITEGAKLLSPQQLLTSIESINMAKDYLAYKATKEQKLVN